MQLLHEGIFSGDSRAPAGLPCRGAMRLGFLLPALFAYLVFRLLRRGSGEACGRRETFLHAAIVTGVFLAALTEGLSAFHALTTPGVVFGWAAGCGVLVWLRCRSAAWPEPPAAEITPRDPLEILLLPVIAALLALVGLTSRLAVPNSWDAMTYHLPRVAHWLQDRSIAIFPTSCLYQNQHAPLAEWAILQLWLLQGHDGLTNLVEFACYAGSIAAVSRLTELCGGSRRAALIAAFFAATLPMAMLQAASAQNDEALGFLLLCTACGCVQLSTRPTWPATLFFGASLGLALLNKATAYLFAPAFCLWVLVALLRQGLGAALPRLLVIALIAVTLNAGYWARNWESSGTLLGSNEDSGPGYRYENEIHTPAAILSNAIRNAALQAPQFPLAHDATVALVRRLHRALGVDPSDPRVTNYAPYFYLPTAPLDDEIANPLHFLAIGLGFLAAVAAWRRVDRRAHFLGASVLIGAFFFCLILKWQPFHSRLQLPLFFLALPVAAIGLGSLRRRIVPLVFVVVMLVDAVPLAFDSYAHPLLGSRSVFHRSVDEERFLIRPTDLPAYENALHLLRDQRVRTVGVIGAAGNSDWEYPLFDPDRMNYGFPWQIEQVGVRNVYAPLETTQPPDAVVSLVPQASDLLTLHGQTYHRVQQSSALSVYLP